jgi:serine/threonine protein kinase
VRAQFGKYELQRRLAVGGMAEIFLASVRGVEGFEKTIVLKRILPHLAEEAEFVEMFIDEAKLASTLSHPNIVQVYELGSIDSRYFIAMEYVPGIDLSTLSKRLVDKGGLPKGAIAAIGIEAARGLHYAHEKRDGTGKPFGLVHRDMSPQNILLSIEGLVKITDFGIAKAENKSSKTRSGVLKGKFSYMAPEQAFGKPLDRRADLFALGLVVYELYTGKRAYKSDNELEMLDMAREARLPPLKDVIPDFPAALSDVVSKALAPKMEDRFATCAEFANALVREAPALAPTFDAEQLSELIRQNVDLTQEVGERVASVPSLPMQVDDDVLMTQQSDMRSVSRAQRFATGAGAQKKSALPWVYVGGGALVAAIGAAAAFVLVPNPSGTAPVLPLPASVPVQAATMPDSPKSAPVVEKPEPKVETAGYFTVNSSPWSYVYIDGKKLSKTTPLQRYRLSIGKHRVKLESPGAEKSREFVIDIKAGRTEQKIVDFSQK